MITHISIINSAKQSSLYHKIFVLMQFFSILSSFIGLTTALHFSFIAWTLGALHTSYEKQVRVCSKLLEIFCFSIFSITKISKPVQTLISAKPVVTKSYTMVRRSTSVRIDFDWQDLGLLFQMFVKLNQKEV